MFYDFYMSLALLVTKITLAQLLAVQISYQNNPKYAKNMKYIEEHYSVTANNSSDDEVSQFKAHQ